MTERLKGTRGEGHIMPAVMTVILCMFLSVFLTFSYAAGLVSSVRRDLRTVLDSYVTSEGIRIYNSIKMGSGSTGDMDFAELEARIGSYLSLASSGNELVSYDNEGRRRFSLVINEIAHTSGDEGKLSVMITYEMKIPVYFGKDGIYEIYLSEEVRSKFNDKFTKG